MINSILLVFIGAVLGIFTGFNVSETPYFYEIMDLFLVIVLFTNTERISVHFRKKHKNKPIILATLGVVFKILVLGAFLYALTGSYISFLIASIISQIDPVSTYKNIKQKYIGAKVKDLILFESAFDDPVSVLLTFYVFLPLTLGVYSSAVNYVSMIAVNLILIAVLVLLHKLKFMDELLVIISILAGFYFRAFLFVAVAGLIVKDIFEPQLDFLSQLIYYLVFPAIGIIASLQSLNIIAGAVIAFLMVFIVRSLEILLIFRCQFKKYDFYELILSEERGITTVLLCLAVQVYHNVIPVIVPALILINAISYAGFTAKKSLNS